MFSVDKQADGVGEMGVVWGGGPGLGWIPINAGAGTAEAGSRGA